MGPKKDNDSKVKEQWRQIISFLTIRIRKITIQIFTNSVFCVVYENTFLLTQKF
jgi:hypothetical protein